MNCTDLHSKGCGPDSEEHLNVCLQTKHTFQCFPEPRPGSSAEQLPGLLQIAPAEDLTLSMDGQRVFALNLFLGWVIFCPGLHVDFAMVKCRRREFCLNAILLIQSRFPPPRPSSPFRIALIKSRYPTIGGVSPNKVFYKAKRVVFAVSRACADGEACIT